MKESELRERERDWESLFPPEMPSAAEADRMRSLEPAVPCKYPEGGVQGIKALAIFPLISQIKCREQNRMDITKQSGVFAN